MVLKRDLKKQPLVSVVRYIVPVSELTLVPLRLRQLPGGHRVSPSHSHVYKAVRLRVDAGTVRLVTRKLLVD